MHAQSETSLLLATMLTTKAVMILNLLEQRARRLNVWAFDLFYTSHKFDMYPYYLPTYFHFNPSSQIS